MILAIIYAGMPRARFKAAVLTTTKQLSPSAVESSWALHPGRGYQQSNPSYKSKFQRYSELILTAVAEPWTQRHSSDLSICGGGPTRLGPAAGPVAAQAWWEDHKIKAMEIARGLWEQTNPLSVPTPVPQEGSGRTGS